MAPVMLGILLFATTGESSARVASRVAPLGAIASLGIR